MAGKAKGKSSSPIGIQAGRRSELHTPTWYKWAPFGILLITAIIYAKAAFNDFTSFDDDFFILNNKLVKDVSFDGLKAIFTSVSSGKYQPLTTLSFAIEYSLFGFNPVSFHITNVLLHLLSTWIVFKIVRKLTQNQLPAIIVALLFAIHPMHVEEVAWASERKDMLYAVFYLAGLAYYIEYVKSGLKRKYFLWTFLFFIASLFSKSEAITFPVLIVAVDLYLGRKRTAGMFLEKIPMLVLSGFILAMSLVSAQTDGALGQVTAASYGFVNRIFLFTTIPAFYLVKLLFPFGLSAMHYYPDMHNGMLPWMYYASLPFVVVICVFLIKFFSGKDISSQKSFLRKQVIFGLSFFVITICVMPQLVSVGPALTPERYTYIPYIGLFFVIAQWLQGIAQPALRSASLILFGSFVTMFCVLTWLRIDVWKDSEVLFTDVIEKNSDVADCSYFYWSRGNYRNSKGELRDAIDDYTQAIRQHTGYMEAYSNRGATYFQVGDALSAIHDYDTAIRYSPNHARSYYNRAAGKATIGDFPGALSDYNRFLELYPNDNQGYADRGMVRLSMTDTAGACADWKRAAELGNERAGQLMQLLCR